MQSDAYVNFFDAAFGELQKKNNQISVNSLQEYFERALLGSTFKSSLGMMSLRLVFLKASFFCF
jgi:hypothetical protein